MHDGTIEECEKLRNLEEQTIDHRISELWGLIYENLAGTIHEAGLLREASERLSYQKGVAQSLLITARCLAGQDKYAEALACAMEAHQICHDFGDEDTLVRYMRIMGFIMLQSGKPGEALSFNIEALKLAREMKVPMLEGVYPIEVYLLNNIGTIFISLERFSAAIEVYKEALDIVKPYGGSLHLLLLTNLAEVLVSIDDTDSALEYIDLARVELGDESSESGLHDLHLIHRCYGVIYKKKGDYETALTSFMRSLSYARQLGEVYSETDVLLMISELHESTGHDEEAERWGQATVRVAQSILSLEHLRKAHALLSRLFEKLGDYQNALAHYQLFTETEKESAAREAEQKVLLAESELKVERAVKDAEIFRLRNIELKRTSDELKFRTAELEDSNRNLAVISQIGQKITASLNLEKILGTLYDSINTLMVASVFGIGLYDEATGIIDYRMFIENGVRLPAYQTSVKNEKSYASQCIRARNSVLLNNLTTDESFRIPGPGGVSNGLSARSLIYHPLILEKRIIGVITVQSYVQNAYTERHLDILKALGSYVAIALNNSQKSEELEKLSSTDSLTGLHNRRYLNHEIDMEIAECRRYPRTFSLILGDLDYFKRVNDTYGHDCGDYVLKTLAEVIRTHLRDSDRLSRWGGEEFLILLPETDCTQARESAERIRQMIEETTLIYEGHPIALTITLGVTDYQGEPVVSEIIRRADQALFKGKEAGRNRVIVSCAMQID